MISKSVRRDYARLRAKNWTAKAAYDAAKIRERFYLAGDLVQLRQESDSDPYDDSYIDTWEDASPSERARLKKEIRDSVLYWGVWGLVAEYRLSEDDAWTFVDSCWGFIGNDVQDNGYDTDLMNAALDALAEAQIVAALALDAAYARSAAEMSTRATYAAG